MGPSTRIDGDVEMLTGWQPFKLLQWGRRLASTETAAADLTLSQATEASMGPSTRIDGDDFGRDAGKLEKARLQWGRRLASTETRA